MTKSLATSSLGDCMESYRMHVLNKYQTVDIFPTSKNRLLLLNL
ncbi:unnamed protein product [Arabidopsis lyrata]|nr:unnamed protein product [Arabidopsis lyrata]